jgi:riboflavin transporter FmnP
VPADSKREHFLFNGGDVMFAKFKKTRYLVSTAMLSSLAFLLALFEIPTPFASYLLLDASEIPILVAGNTLGVPAMVVTILIRSLFRFMFRGTLLIGEVAAIIASLIFGLTFIYITKILNKKSVDKNKKITNVFGLVTVLISTLLIVTLVINNPEWLIFGILTALIPIGFAVLGFLKPTTLKQQVFLQAVTSTLLVTIVMVIANFLFITPTFFVQRFALYTEIVDLYFEGNINQYLATTILPLVPFNIFKFSIMNVIYFSIERVVKYQNWKKSS